MLSAPCFYKQHLETHRVLLNAFVVVVVSSDFFLNQFIAHITSALLSADPIIGNATVLYPSTPPRTIFYPTSAVLLVAALLSLYIGHLSS